MLASPISIPFCSLPAYSQRTRRAVWSQHWSPAALAFTAEWGNPPPLRIRTCAKAYNVVLYSFGNYEELHVGRIIKLGALVLAQLRRASTADRVGHRMQLADYDDGKATRESREWGGPGVVSFNAPIVRSVEWVREIAEPGLVTARNLIFCFDTREGGGPP